MREGVPWMLWWIIGIHVGWALGLWFEYDQVARLIILLGLDWLNTPWLSVVLLLVSGLATSGLVLEKWVAQKFSFRTAFLFMMVTLLPQYFLVLTAFMSDVHTLIFGYQTNQGMAISPWVILCALLPVVWGAVLHTGAVLERYVRPWGRSWNL